MDLKEIVCCKFGLNSKDVDQLRDVVNTVTL